MDGLQTLLDERAIIKVMLKFGRSLDLGDWPGYRACFTDKLLVDFSRLTGQPKILVDADDWTRFADLILTPVRRHHSYSNFSIDMQGDRAEAVWYHTSRHWKSTDMGAPFYHQYGWYDGTFLRQGGVWKMAYVKHDFQWVEGNNAMFDMTEPNLAAQMQKVFSPANVAAAQGV
jgi:hypothetical protein